MSLGSPIYFTAVVKSNRTFSETCIDSFKIVTVNHALSFVIRAAASSLARGGDHCLMECMSGLSLEARVFR